MDLGLAQRVVIVTVAHRTSAAPSRGRLPRRVRPSRFSTATSDALTGQVLSVSGGFNMPR